MNERNTMLKIRDLNAADYAPWLKLYEVYADYYEVNLTADIIKTVWNWLTDDAHPLIGILAVDEEELVGLAHYREMPSPLLGKNVGFLDDIVVAPAARGRNVSAELLEEVRRRALLRGWPVVRWTTKDNNYKARIIYDRFAFKTDRNFYEMPCNKKEV